MKTAYYLLLAIILLAAAFQASGSPQQRADKSKQSQKTQKAAVEAAGGDFNSVIKLNYYCAESVDPSQITTVREIRDKYVNTANPPASTLAVVNRLVRPEWLMEVDAVAVIAK